MQKLNSMLREAGVPPMFIGIIALIVTLAIVGVIVFIFVYDSINNIAFPPWLLLILGALAQFIIVILTTSHTTNTINGTAAQTAAQTAQVVEQNASVTAAQVEAATRAQLASQKQADNHSFDLQVQRDRTASTQANDSTQAMEENTEATRENTEKMRGMN